MDTAEAGEVLLNGTKVQKAFQRQFLEIAESTRTLDTFPDGSPAVIGHPCGTGRVIHFAYYPGPQFLESTGPAHQAFVRSLLPEGDDGRFCCEKGDGIYACLMEKNGKRLLLAVNGSDTRQMLDLSRTEVTFPFHDHASGGKLTSPIIPMAGGQWRLLTLE